MSGLSNTDIDNILGHYERYGGCMSKDKLKKYNPNDEKYYILNMESSRQGDRRGSHWILLYTKGKDAFYFDSFGAYLPPKVVKDFCKEKKIMTSDVKFQSDKSNACGNFCILVALMIEKGYSPKRIVEKELPKLVKNSIDLDPST